MASLYNGNVMKSIVTISSACALAFAGMASAQDAPAPAPAAETPAAPVAPAAEVSKEAKEAADQMLALMKMKNSLLKSVCLKQLKTSWPRNSRQQCKRCSIN